MICKCGRVVIYGHECDCGFPGMPAVATDSRVMWRVVKRHDGLYAIEQRCLWHWYEVGETYYARKDEAIETIDNIKKSKNPSEVVWTD